ncbi:MAG TPA: DUF2752 domain-containing protein [Verrucomicrobiae bacterium]|nr:DUF2752 domain-containing protein [Verrucomicrobiae bacterium]
MIFLACVLAAIAIALTLGALQITLPACSLKRMTGIPCAGCGGTRCLQAIGHFHFAEAFWLNPLVTIAALAAPPIALISFLLPQRLDRIIRRIPLIPVALTLFALNWIFVIKFLPR